MLLPLALGAFWNVGGAEGPQPSPPKAILLLDQDDFGHPAYMMVRSAFRPLIAGRLGPDTVVYTENLDSTLFDGEDYQKGLKEWLRHKYQDRRVDAIVSIGEVATGYAVALRRELWPDVPVLFCDQRPGVKPEPHVTGLTTSMDVEGTLRAALELCPGTNQIACITSPHSTQQELDEAARDRAEAEATRRGLRFLALDHLAMPELEGRLRALPAGTIVLCLSFEEDEAGQRFAPAEAFSRLAKASSVPMFSVHDLAVGKGAVGGSVLDLNKVGTELGELTAEALAAGKDAEIPVRESRGYTYLFDSRAMQRWGLEEGRLPPGSEVRNRVVSPWKANKKLFVGIIAALVIQATLIVFLLLNRRQRRVAEQSLRESEEHIGIACDSAELGLWVWSPENDRIWCTELTAEFFGLASGASLKGADLLERVHSDDRVSYRAAWGGVTAERPVFDLEYRVCMPDGAERWLSSRGRGTLGADGQVLRVTGVTMNITPQRKMEMALRENQEQLSHAARVATMGEISASLAHELSQPLSSILWNAEAAERLLLNGNVDLQELQRCVEDILEDDRRASEVLQSVSRLMKKAPVMPATENLCELVAATMRLVRPDLRAREVSSSVNVPSKPVLWSVDRVQIQQVLINLCLNGADAMAHRPASERLLKVTLAQPAPDCVEVSVEDRGTGLTPEQMERVFEPFHSTKASGLGMGLAICRTIIQSHSGQLSLTNNAGVGATARFILKTESPS